MTRRETSVDDLIEQKLTEQYQKYYRLAYSYVRNEADAMDIVQEGAYRAILKSNTLQKREYLETWLYRIMINAALDFIRKNRRECTGIEGTSESGASQDRYEDIDLARAIKALGEPDTTIIRLRYYEEMKLEQVAEIIGENVNTVKSRLYRALKKLRLAIE